MENFLFFPKNILFFPKPCDCNRYMHIKSVSNRFVAIEIKSNPIPMSKLSLIKRCIGFNCHATGNAISLLM